MVKKGGEKVVKKKGSDNMIGSWAFLIGVILAVLFGLVGMNTYVTYFLVLLGIIIGLLNISEKEVYPFLISGVVLVVVSTFGAAQVSNVPWFENTLLALSILFVPSTIIVALKLVFSLARE